MAATSDEGNFLRQNIPGAASATPATSEAVASEAAGGGNSSWMLYIISETVILKGKINQSLTNLYKLSKNPEPLPPVVDRVRLYV